MTESRITPGNMISVNDAARMIVRGSLIVAPSDMREQYASFVSPLNMGRGGYGDEEKVSYEVRQIFDSFVQTLKNFQFSNEKNSTLQEIKDQVKQVLDLAKLTIMELEEYKQKTKDKSTTIILQQMKTITENISNRHIVETYPIRKSMFTGLYGSLGENNVITKTVFPTRVHKF